MDFIDGIGGVFLFSNHPKELAVWYRENLGINFEESSEYNSIYKIFAHRDLKDPSIERSMALAILPAKSDIKGKPRTGQINYRVKSMSALLAHLQSKKVKIDKAEDHDYGKFAWVTDPDGNKVELFEDSAQ